MKSNGYILKVIPGENYLKELRECATGQLANDKYSNELVIEYFKKNVIFEQIKNLTYEKSVNRQELKNSL